MQDTSHDNWTNWKWHLQNRLNDPHELKNYIPISEEEEKVFKEADEFFTFGVTPYYLSLIDPNNPTCPIRLQVVPRAGELTRHPLERIDPLGEEAHMPVKGVTHRYPDRALWYLSHNCAVFCRFCTRKRKAGRIRLVLRRVRL